MTIDYYPGCTIKASARQSESSALAVLQVLGLQAREMENWNCCGVVHSLASDNLIRRVAPIRVFTRLQEQGSQELVTFCDMCYNTLAQANRFVQQHPERSEAVNDFIGADQGYAGQVSILHLLQILRDRVGFAQIKRHVRRPLTGLTVFPYYGCKLLRPGEVGIDDPETPTILRDLMQALGATVIDDPVGTQCCGAYHVVDREQVVAGRVAAIIGRAQACGAAALVLSCPLCHFNLDTRQMLLDAPLPVFYYTQLMGIALGVEPAVLGFDGHRVDPLPLLQQHQFVREEGVPV